MIKVITSTNYLRQSTNYLWSPNEKWM